MPVNTNTIKNQLYGFLKGQGFNPTRYNSNWDRVQVSDEADLFQFKFEKDGKNYGTVTIMIDSDAQLIMFFPDSVASSPTSDSDGISWPKFVQLIKRWTVVNHALKKFKLENESNMEDYVATRRYEKRKLKEGYYGTKNTSYTDAQPKSIKIIFKHSKPIGEGDQRFRNIQKIFLENEHGERILAPTTKPSIGRAFARCLAEGDEVNGVRWKHIVEMSEEINKLGGFLRATRNKTVNESVGKLISEAQSYYDSLRSSIKNLQSTRGYNNYFESWKPQLNETEDGNSVLEMFRNNSVDPRIEGALPILTRLNKNITEMNEISVFENWADEIVNETLAPTQSGQVSDLVDLIGADSEVLNLGPDATNAIEELRGIIEDDKLNNRLQKAAQSNPDADARPIIVGWMQENSGVGKYAEILKQINSTEKSEPEAAEVKEPAPKKPEVKAPAKEPAAGEIPPPPLEEDGEKIEDQEEDLWDYGQSEQEFKSDKTSINAKKLPATFGKLDKIQAIKPGMVIADIGGGKHDNAMAWAKEHDAELLVYDPFNRSAEHNKEVVSRLAGGKADIATCNNVLNVIKEPENRERVIKQVYNVLKPGGTAYFLIYEGDKSGKGKPTQNNLSWQNNLPTRAYADEVAKFFDDVKATGGMLVASKGGAMGEGKTNKDRKDLPTQRNFVAKNAQTSGAGKHKDDAGYKRKEKHPQRELRKMEFGESFIDKIKRLSGL